MNNHMKGIERAFKKSQAEREATLQRIEENNYNLNPEAYIRNRKRMLQKEIDAIRAEIEETNKLIKLKDEKIAALKAENEKSKAAIAAKEVSKSVQASQSLVDKMKASVAAIKASKPSVAPQAPAVQDKDPSIAALEAALTRMGLRRQ
mgnify:CR=1 FL=1